MLGKKNSLSQLQLTHVGPTCTKDSFALLQEEREGEPTQGERARGPGRGPPRRRQKNSGCGRRGLLPRGCATTGAQGMAAGARHRVGARPPELGARPPCPPGLASGGQALLDAASGRNRGEEKKAGSLRTWPSRSARRSGWGRAVAVAGRKGWGRGRGRRGHRGILAGGVPTRPSVVRALRPGARPSRQRIRRDFGNCIIFVYCLKLF